VRRRVERGIKGKDGPRALQTVAREVQLFHGMDLKKHCE
jgi:hypothetical protein